MCKTRFDSQGMILNRFIIKIIFQNTFMARETPPLHGKCHLKFPFCFFEPFPLREGVKFCLADFFAAAARRYWGYSPPAPFKEFEG